VIRKCGSVRAGVVWLTQAQRDEVEALMEECERSLAFDTTSWLLSDCLLRAANTAKRPA
jgi:hypothetical protein